MHAQRTSARQAAPHLTAFVAQRDARAEAPPDSKGAEFVCLITPPTAASPLPHTQQHKQHTSSFFDNADEG